MIGLMLSAAMLQAADPCLAVEAAVARPATCPDWRPLFVAEGRQMFFDPASIRRNGDSFEMRHRALLPVALRGAWSIIITNRYDCARRTLTGLGGIFYDDRGVRLRDYTPEGAQAEPQPIRAGAPFDRILTDYCPPPAA